MTAFERIKALSADDDLDQEEVDTFIDSTSCEDALESFKSDFIDKEFKDIKDKVAKEAELEAEKDFPTSKLVADFEELMREEERFKKLDETIRGVQRSRQEVAATTSKKKKKRLFGKE